MFMTGLRAVLRLALVPMLVALPLMPMLDAPMAQAKGGSTSKPVKPSKPMAGRSSGATTASYSTPIRTGSSRGGAGVMP